MTVTTGSAPEPRRNARRLARVLRLGDNSKLPIRPFHPVAITGTDADGAETSPGPRYERFQGLPASVLVARLAQQLSARERADAEAGKSPLGIMEEQQQARAARFGTLPATADSKTIAARAARFGAVAPIASAATPARSDQAVLSSRAARFGAPTANSASSAGLTPEQVKALKARAARFGN